jgi:modulator of FtsH protease
VAVARSLAGPTTGAGRNYDLSLAVSAMFILLMSGLILYQTSQIIHGGETNYIMATVTLYISIYNLFLSLLQLLGALGGDE